MLRTKGKKPMINQSLAFAEFLYETMTKAEKGDKQAQHYLAKIYEEGLVVQQDLKEALKWYRRLALQGDRSAQRKVKEIEIQ